MTHTQGPLSVHPYTTPPWQEVEAGAGHGAFRCASIGIGAGRKIVAQVRAQKPIYGFPEVDNEAELLANAALFIAAPDLLDALAELADLFAHDGENSMGRFERLALMFRKDTGFLAPGKDQPMCGPDQPDGNELRVIYDAWYQAKVDRARAAIAKARDTASVQAALDALRPATPSISKEGE